MAGAGIKNFGTEVLSSNDVDQYLMHQSTMVFATTTARTTAFSTQGITPSTGMMSFITGTKTLEIYDGTAWISIVATSGVPAMGVVIPTSVAGSGVSLSSVGTVTFSTASAVSINGCFSALYQNYKIEISITSSNQVALLYRFRTAGSDNITANYGNQAFVADSTSVGAARTTTQTQGDLGQMCLSDLSFFDITIYSPFETAKTGMLVQNGSMVGEAYMRNQVNTMKTSTSFDGITLFPTTGTITGTARVYGYR
jgi:hypothetical protein